MLDIEVEFLEQYKRADAICKDMFASETGISEYISRMESIPSGAVTQFPEWNTVYYELKHLRHVRNKITHSVESSGCSEEDLILLERFRKTLLSGSDPLTMYHKIVRQRSQQEKTAKKEQTNVRNDFVRNKASYEMPNEKKKTGNGFDFLAVLTIILGLMVLAGLLYLIIFILPDM